MFKQQIEDMGEIKMGACPLLNGPEKIQQCSSGFLIIVINYFWGDLEGENVFDLLGFLYKKDFFFSTYCNLTLCVCVDCIFKTKLGNLENKIALCIILFTFMSLWVHTLVCVCVCDCVYKARHQYWQQPVET